MQGLVEFSFSKLAKRLSFKPHGLIYVVFEVSFDGLPFHGFSADSLWKHTPLHAHGIGAVGNVAWFFGHFAPNGAAAVKHGAFFTFKRRTCWRTSFCLSQ